MSEEVVPRSSVKASFVGLSVTCLVRSASQASRVYRMWSVSDQKALASQDAVGLVTT